MNAGGRVAKLVGATKLKIDAIGAIEMKKVISLDEGVGEFSIGNARTTFADAILDKFAVEKLGHRKCFSDSAEEVEIVDVFEPVVVVDHGELIMIIGWVAITESIGGTIKTNDRFDLFFDAGLVVLDFVYSFESTFTIFFWVTDLTSGATNEEIWLVAVADKTSTHHERGEIANGQRISGWVGTPIEFLDLAIIKFFRVFDGIFGDKTAPG